MNKIIYLIIQLWFFIILVNASKSNRENGNDEAKKYEYGVSFHLYSLFIILVSSFIGTAIPMLLHKRPFFSIEGNVFNSLKMFGTGVIVAVAFVHMLSPADKILSGEDAPIFFQERYDSFSGVFAVLGIILGHGIQILLKEYFKSSRKAEFTSSTVTNSASNLQSETKRKSIQAINDKDKSISNQNNYEHDPSVDDNESHINIYETEGNLDHTFRRTSSENEFLLANKDQSIQNYHTHAHAHEHIHTDNDCCGAEILFLHSKKQIVSYLLEIGISMHSVLIGFTFGTNFDEELNLLLIALMFHQFFEGIALSTVFIEAKFKNRTAPLIMMVAYCSTMPLGGLLGLIVHNLINQNSVLLACIQGILDSVAAGLLIYDSIVNILFNYTSSKKWDSLSRKSKAIQMISFYLGCTVMALIGIWA